MRPAFSMMESASLQINPMHTASRTYSVPIRESNCAPTRTYARICPSTQQRNDGAADKAYDRYNSVLHFSPSFKKRVQKGNG